MTEFKHSAALIPSCDNKAPRGFNESSSLVWYRAAYSSIGLSLFKTPEPPREALRVINPPGGISVGVVWASNPDNKAMYRNKSLPLALLDAPV